MAEGTTFPIYQVDIRGALRWMKIRGAFQVSRVTTYTYNTRADI